MSDPRAFDFSTFASIFALNAVRVRSNGRALINLSRRDAAVGSDLTDWGLVPERNSPMPANMSILAVFTPSSRLAGGDECAMDEQC